MLSASRRPLILAGGGAVRASAVPALAERLDAPVVMTTNARGLLPPVHPLGVSVSPSCAATRTLMAEADVVLALGTELGSTDYDMYEDGGFALPGVLIRVDLDPLQLWRRGMPAVPLVGDAGLAAEALLAAVAARPPGEGAARARRASAGSGDLEPGLRGDLALLELLREALPGSLMVGDSTQATYAGNLGFAAARAGGWFNSATGFGTLGYGLPAAIGAALADERPVLCLTGDGGLQFSLGELASAAEARVPVIAILYDNQGYGEIKSSMVAQGVPPLGVDLLTPDLAAVAAAAGWAVSRVTTPEALRDEVGLAAGRAGPTLLVHGDALREAFRPREDPK